MTPTEHSNDGRTLMAAVLFADLVGYSKKPLTDQMAAKEAFRGLLLAALAPVAPGSRVVVDTGDGAAVAFLADPEHALYFAMRLRRDVQAVAAQGLLQPEDLRLGINLGPVRRAVDVNGRPNLVGEGMNSAERVMSFSAPGETTASRSFRDAVSCLHASYQQLFEPMGQRADKHGRQHEVFRIAALQQAFEAATASLAPAPVAESGEAPKPGRQGRAATPEAHRPSPEVRSVVSIAAVVIALVAIGVVWSMRGPGDPPPNEIPSRPTPANSAGEMQAPAPEGKADTPVSAGAVEPVGESGKASAEPGSTAAPPLESQALAPHEDEAKPTASAPTTARREPAKAAKATRSATGAAPSPRCTLLLQRAALGERLTTPEQEELRTSCR